MTQIQIYLLIAPLLLVALGAGAAWWWTSFAPRHHRGPAE